MPEFEITSPDGKTFVVTAPEGATQEQVLSYAKSQWQQPEAPKASEGPSIGDRAARVAGLGARSLVTGLTAIPTLMAEGVAAPLRALTGGRYFQSPSAVLQRTMTEAGVPEPANAVERLSTNIAGAMAGAGTTQAAANLAQPISMVGQGIRDLLLQQPARQLAAAGTGAASSTVAGELGAGPVGQMAAGVAGSMLPFVPQMVRGTPRPEQMQTAEVAARGREAGYVLPPSQTNPSVVNKTLGGFSGQARTEQAASLKNQAVTNRLARQDLGIADDAPLNRATLEAFRNRMSAPYREIAAIVPNGRQAIDDLRNARFQANDYWRFYNRTGDPEARTQAAQLSQQVQQMEGALETAAAAANRPNLVDELRRARVQIAKSYDYERALNLDTGNVDARIIGNMRDRSAYQTREMGTIGSMANSFDRSMQSMDGRTPPFISPLDAAVTTAPLIGAAMSGRPEVAMLAAIPFLRPAVRSMILSEPYQALMASPMTAPLARPDAATLGLLSSAYNAR